MTIAYHVSSKARRWREDLERFAAWHMPKNIVLWCFVRIVAHATTGRWNESPAKLTVMEAMERWREP